MTAAAADNENKGFSLGGFNHNGNQAHKALARDIQLLSEKMRDWQIINKESRKEIANDLKEFRQHFDKFQLGVSIAVSNLETREKEWKSMAKGMGALYGFLVSLIMCGITAATLVLMAKSAG